MQLIISTYSDDNDAYYPCRGGMMGGWQNEVLAGYQIKWLQQRG
jgi:hypothetical protein